MKTSILGCRATAVIRLSARGLLEIGNRVTDIDQIARAEFGVGWERRVRIDPKWLRAGISYHPSRTTRGDSPLL